MSVWSVWQLIDSAFPIGTFAHSWGLEAAWQFGEVRDESELRRFVQVSVWQAGHSALPFVNGSYSAPEDLERLDELCDAFLVNVVANRASRTQGRTLIATAARVWPRPGLGELSLRAERTHGHLAPIYGATFRALDLPLTTVQEMLLFSTVRGVLSAAVRLGIVGSYEAQRVQASCEPLLDDVMRRCRGLRDDEFVQTAPIADLFQSAHDRLYSRLFQS